MILTSTAFADGQPIPKKYTQDGQNISPPLTWADVPEATAEFALIMEDPDAPMAEPFVHWVAAGILAQTRELAENRPQHESLTQPPGMVQGVTSFGQGKIGYRGPAPPKGHGPHRYYFTLHALNKPLGLTGRIDKQTLLDAIKRSAKVLAQTTLMGTYERK